MRQPSRPDSSPEAAPAGPNAPIWKRVDELVGAMPPEDADTHKVAALAARAYRARGRELPPLLAHQERAAILGPRLAARVLERAHEAYDGELLLLKGPEVAARYPGHTRVFVDLDVLADDAEAAQSALVRAGFVQIDDPDGEYADIHHLTPVQFESIPLILEVHSEVKAPHGIAPPPKKELFAAAVPALSHEALRAPAPHHHALILAAHAWAHTPLGRLRDLLDVTLFVAECDPDLLRRDAERWGLARVLGATTTAADWLLAEGRRPLSVSLWARHLLALREPSVLEGHLTRWLAPFWAFPPDRAARRSLENLRRDFGRAEGESWHAKIRNLSRAARNARKRKSEHGWRLDDEGEW